jgi:hypothetical protein
LRQGGHYEHNNQEGCKAAGHERRNHSTWRGLQTDRLRAEWSVML